MPMHFSTQAFTRAKKIHSNQKEKVHICNRPVGKSKQVLWILCSTSLAGFLFNKCDIALNQFVFFELFFQRILYIYFVALPPHAFFFNTALFLFSHGATDFGNNRLRRGLIGNRPTLQLCQQVWDYPCMHQAHQLFQVFGEVRSLSGHAVGNSN